MREIRHRLRSAHRRAPVWLLAGAAGMLLGVAMAIGIAGSNTGGPPEAGGRGARLESRESFLELLIPPAPDRVRGPRVARSIEELARRLPLERKVAQVFSFGFRGQDLTAPVFRVLRRLDLGAIVIGTGNYVDAGQLGSMAGEARVIATQEGHVPPWVMADQEGGAFNEFPDLPPATSPGELRSPRQAAVEAGQAATTLLPLGVNALLAPDLDVHGAGAAEDPARLFSDDATRVAAFARAVVGAYSRARMFTAARHFPGLGAASQSTEDGPADVGLSLSQLLARDVLPFRAAIAAGAPAVMVGHGLYATDEHVTPASLSRNVMVGLLRRRLHFRGVAMTDDLSSPAITVGHDVPAAAVAALKAGADLLYISAPRGDQEAAYAALLHAVRRGAVRQSRLQEAVLRVLEAKRRFGLIR